MALKCGIVGLPNVGKSTLFNALTNAKALAANYPFATKEPNVGTITVPDDRLMALAKLVNPRKIIPTTVEIVNSDRPSCPQNASGSSTVKADYGFLTGCRTLRSMPMISR